MLFARNLKERLMGNAIWIERHVGGCIQSNLSTETFSRLIAPVIVEAINQQLNEVELEIRIAEVAQKNLKSNYEIALTINCVNGAVVHEAKNQGLPAFEGIYLLLSYALIGRFFSITSRKIGYIL